MAQTALNSVIESRSSTSRNYSEVWPKLGIRWSLLGMLLALLIVVFLLSLALGSVNIPLRDTIRILLGDEPARSTWKTIVLKVRLPGALTAALAGAALAVSGLQMQTFFRNPLAEPFVLGISSGASLGVALVVLTAGTGVGATLLAGVNILNNLSLAVAATVGAATVMCIILVVAWRVRSTMTLLILGIMFAYGTSAVVSLLMYFSIQDRLKVFLNWSFGSFSGVTWSQIPVFAPAILIGLGLAFLIAKPLNVLLLGDAYARSMGLNIQRARLWIIVSTSILAGTVTAFCGPIGFIGIAVPHVCRMLFNTSDHRVLVPASMLLGASVALVADLIAHLPGNQAVLPINAVTALLGAPLVVWIILRQRNFRASFAA